MARFLSSWVYVNQTPFNEPPNVYAFLRGDRPNWALIGSRHLFERDIEEQMYDELLDYATSSKKEPTANILLGPAGYGVATLLMTLATRLVQERGGLTQRWIWTAHKESASSVWFVNFDHGRCNTTHVLNVNFVRAVR